VLLDFTGSDWCPWCIKFDQEVLSTGKFSAYAGQKLELVRVDFPRHTPLPDDQRRANDALAAQFNVDGYPTQILLNSAGKELGRQGGYLAGGPDAFIAELEKFSQ
jgi:thioredoxin-related protein